MVAGIELVTELLSAAVILMALDKLATAIRWTYAAGRFTGRLWFTYGLPAFLMAADGISWLNSMIDWRFVAATVWDCLKVVAVLAITAWTLTCDAHKRWVGSIDWSRPVTPAINPLWVVADELNDLSCSQIRSAFGLKQKTSKARLIGAALAVC